MNCRQFQIHLEQTFEFPHSSSAELQRHGETCLQPECREAWADFLLLEEAIQDWRRQPSCETLPTPQPPKQAIQRQAIQRSRRGWTSSRKKWRNVTESLSLPAAAFLLVVLIFHGASELSSKLSPESMRFETAGKQEAIKAISPQASRESASKPEVFPGMGENVLALQNSAPAGFLVNWVAGTPLQVSGSMALLLLRDRTHQGEASSWTPVWMEGWSEQLIPTSEDIEILRNLLLEPGNQRSQLREEHRETTTMA